MGYSFKIGHWFASLSLLYLDIVTDIRRVTSIKLFGVTMTNHLSAGEHFRVVILSGAVTTPGFGPACAATLSSHVLGFMYLIKPSLSLGHAPGMHCRLTLNSSQPAPASARSSRHTFLVSPSPNFLLVFLACSFSFCIIVHCTAPLSPRKRRLRSFRDDDDDDDETPE